MTEIEVRDCLVRVVRHGGWSWGADPRGLLDEVLAAVPVLVAEALAAGVPDGADGEVREPLRVAVPLRAVDLAALAATGRRGPGRRGAGGSAAAAALTVAVQGALAARGITTRSPAAGDQGPDGPVAAGPPRPPGPAALRLLLAWRRDGRLADLLGRLPVPVLAAWDEALVAGWRTPPAAAPDAAELAGALAEAAAGWDAGPPDDAAAWLRRRLAGLTAVAASTGLAPCQPEVLAALAGRLGPRPAAARPAPGAAVAARPDPPATAPPRPPAVEADAPAAPARPAPAAAGRPAGEVRIASALPFLVLVPLARAGWLDTLTVAVEAAGLGQHWATLAAALAFKVLDPPGHGWRRSPEDRTVAAAFAGVGEPLVERALPDQAGLLPPALDALLGRSLLDGHTPGAPLVLVEAGAGDGLVLFDGEGLFPIAWAGDRQGLAGWLDGCPGERVVGDAGAGRPGGADDRDLLDRAGLVLAELRRRRAMPLAADPALERSLTLAAGAGLATIAWTLWHEREPTDPLLATERLASLSAVVRGGGDRVRVTVPLGARAFALQAGGLLGEVPEVPWLGGRTVELNGG